MVKYLVRPKTYLHALINTFSSTKYYVDVLNAKFRFSLRFFVMSYVCLIALGIILFHFFDLPRYQSLVTQAFTELQHNYPSQLEVTWNGQTLMTKPQQAIQLSYPSFFKNEALPTLLAVIDTNGNDPKTTLNQLQLSSLFFVNSTTLFVSNGTDTWSSLALRDLQLPMFSAPFTLNQHTAPAIFATWQRTTENMLALLQVAYPFIVIPLTMLFRLLSLAVESLLIFYVLRFIGQPRLHFIKIYQIGLHVVVVAETAQLLITHLFPSSGVPVFGLCFWIYMMVILLQLRHVKMVTLSQPST